MAAGALTWLGHTGQAVLAGVAIAALAGSVASATGRSKLGQRLVTAASLAYWAVAAILLTLFLTSQFQFEYVRTHSLATYPFEYKLAGVWSGQQGSFLLWACMSATGSLLLGRRLGTYAKWFHVANGAFLAALGGILCIESPFALSPAQADLTNGLGMAPSLLNYWMVIHPPTIFFGFGLLTSLFCLSLSALATGNLDDWIDIVRPYAILATTVLGLGLCMGGFWAYETLGWGGFWMWDPVENTSFVPWAAATAFLHGIFVQKAKRGWKLANAVLGGLPFLLFGYGTFLTRSGFLSGVSVHSFAQMDNVAKMILIAIVAAFFLVFIAATVHRARAVSAPVQQPRPAFLSKGVWYTAGVVLLLAMAAVTLVGMSVPFIQSVSNQPQKVVQEQLYNTVSTFFYIPILIAMAFAPFLGWRKTSPLGLASKFVNILAASIGTTGFVLLWAKWGGHEVAVGPLILGFPGQATDPAQTIDLLMGAVKVNRIAWVLSLTWLVSFAAYANLWRAAQLVRSAKMGTGGLLSHIGVLLTLAGLVFSRGLEQSADGVVHTTKTLEAFGYKIDLQGMTKTFVDRDNKIRLKLTKEGDTFVAMPGLYFVPGQNEPMPIIWPYVGNRGIYDLYIVVAPFSITPEGVDYGGSQPVTLSKGHSADFNGWILRYDSMEMQGEGGALGTRFVAKGTVSGPHGPIDISPSIVIAGPGKVEQPEQEFTEGMAVQLLSVDAKTHDATFAFKFTTPAYPVTVMYKPMTFLVWWGVGIMTLGGLMAAWSRRTPKARETDSETDAPE